MDKEINNGFDYIDLELPSGTLWATCNVGADKPTDYGLYFQWGDTVGYAKDQIGKVKKFNWADYKWSIDGSSSNFTKYKTTNEALELEDDAAHVHMGGEWHMPTSVQIQELIDNTTSTWTTQDGVNGRLFTSKKNPSKSIFFPSAGSAWSGSIHDRGSFGGVWSSVLGTFDVSYGQLLGFGSGNAYLGDFSRYYGFSVRGVIG